MTHIENYIESQMRHLQGNTNSEYLDMYDAITRANTKHIFGQILAGN